jgi:anion-transporting  ArsA/GET3 family ATPase
MGAIEFATTLAPGLRDVLLTGKVKECVTRTGEDGRYYYDAVVLDAPPTGRVVTFLDVTKAMADLARSGPINRQSEGVVQLLHSEDTVVHMVTIGEDLPVTETLETVSELDAADLRVGAVIVNRADPRHLPTRSVESAADGRVDRTRLRAGLAAAGVDLSPEQLDGLVAETVEHAIRMRADANALARLTAPPPEGPAEPLPRLELPEMLDGIELGALYELAEVLGEQGVRSNAVPRAAAGRSAGKTGAGRR